MERKWKVYPMESPRKVCIGLKLKSLPFSDRSSGRQTDRYSSTRRHIGYKANQKSCHKIIRGDAKPTTIYLNWRGGGISGYLFILIYRPPKTSRDIALDFLHFILTKTLQGYTVVIGWCSASKLHDWMHIWMQVFPINIPSISHAHSMISSCISPSDSIVDSPREYQGWSGAGGVSTWGPLLEVCPLADVAPSRCCPPPDFPLMTLLWEATLWGLFKPCTAISQSGEVLWSILVCSKKWQLLPRVTWTSGVERSRLCCCNLPSPVPKVLTLLPSFRSSPAEYSG